MEEFKEYIDSLGDLVKVLDSVVNTQAKIMERHRAELDFLLSQTCPEGQQTLKEYLKGRGL